MVRVPGDETLDLIYASDTQIRLIVNFTLGQGAPNVSLGVTPAGGRQRWAFRNRSIPMRAATQAHGNIAPESVYWLSEYLGRTAVMVSTERNERREEPWWNGPTNRRINRTHRR